MKKKKKGGGGGGGGGEREMWCTVTNPISDTIFFLRIFNADFSVKTLSWINYPDKLTASWRYTIMKRKRRQMNKKKKRKKN